MVVAVTAGRHLRRDYWSLRGPAVLFAAIAALSMPAQSAGGPSPFTPLGMPTPNPAFPESNGGSAISPEALSQGQVFDPAYTSLRSLWSYGAMRTIAPNAYGNFVSPVGGGMESAFGTSNMSGVLPMSGAEGIDPEAGAMLSGSISSVDTVQFGNVSGGGGSSGGGSGSSVVVAASGAGPNPSGAVVGAPGTVAVSLPGRFTLTTATGIVPGCGGANQLPNVLQAGGEFWNGQAVSTAPVQFAHGLFAGAEGGDPLGDLGGPSSQSSNITPQGQEGAWCVPPSPPFSLSSPLEDRVPRILFAIVLIFVLTFFLSRGFQRPARSFDQTPSLVRKREIWHFGLRRR
jgi:hypothetical protein